MNLLVRPSEVRQVAFKVAVAGKPLPGVISMGANQNSHYQADTWKATFALNAPGGQTLDWWGSDALYGQTFVLSARMQPSDDWTQLITGDADKVAINVPEGTVSCSGRDLTSRLIEARTQESFLNKTSSEVATTLAQRRGLTPVVTATTTLVSRYYQQDHDSVSHDQFSRSGTEWDLLSFLAQNEGFDLFVTGMELHFQPYADKPEQYAVTWDQVQRQGNLIGLTLDRSLTLAKGVIVVVRSWNSRQGRAFTRTSPPGSGKGPVNAGKAQRFAYTRPNLTEDQAQKLADSLRADITKHERTGSLRLPVELASTPRDQILLQGCDASWDQAYYIASIDRSFEQDGTMQTIEFKNHSPQSQASFG